MSLQCPRCHSPKVAFFHHAMKVRAPIGTVGGVARGVSAALAGGKAGAARRARWAGRNHSRYGVGRHPRRLGWRRPCCVAPMTKPMSSDSE